MKEPSSPKWSSLGLLVGLILGIGILANLLSLGIWHVFEIPYDGLSGENILSSMQRFRLRLGLSVNHLGLFLIPGILWLMYVPQNKFSYLKRRLTKDWQILQWILIVFCSYPLIASLAQWNMSISLPEWMQSSNDAQMVLMQQLLIMDNVGELLFNLILVGALAAIGEEIIFRGIIQQVLTDRLKSPFAAIVISSIIFGAFHMQFERFLPLAFLGLLLGLAYYYFESILLVVILHFLNNSIQVILLYFSNTSELPDIDDVPDIPIQVTIASIILTGGLIYFAISRSNVSRSNKSYELRS